MKFLSIGIAVFIIVGSGFFLLNKNTQNEQVTQVNEKVVTIRITTSSTTINPWELVQKLTGRDILAEENIKIETITSVGTGGGVGLIQALVAKNIDYVSGPAMPAWINGLAAGTKIKAVRGSYTIRPENNHYWLVLENSSIYSAKDFVGKRIGVNAKGALSDYSTRVYLKNNRIPDDQVELVVVPREFQEQMLRDKQVDIITVDERDKQVAIARGGIRVATTAYEIMGNRMRGAGGFREDFIKEHPDTVKRFVTVYERSHRLIRDEFKKDPAAVRKAVAEILKKQDGKPETASYFVPEFDPGHPFLTDGDVQWWIDRIVEDGKLKPDQIKPSDIYTNEFNPYYYN